MNPEEIRLMLHKVVSDLRYIERSEALQQIAHLPHASGEIEAMAISTLDMAIALKLKFSQALDANLDNELDQLFKEAA